MRIVQRFKLYMAKKMQNSSLKVPHLCSIDRALSIKQVDALGNVTTFTYDGNGNLVSKTDPDGYTIICIY